MPFDLIASNFEKLGWKMTNLTYVLSDFHFEFAKTLET